jgi:hypothetical protein
MTHPIHLQSDWLYNCHPKQKAKKISKSTPLLLLPPQKKTLIKKMEKKEKVKKT